MLWPHTVFQEVLSTGTGQQFVFSTALVDAHHAWEIVGSASMALDFDYSGRFLGARLIGLALANEGCASASRSSGRAPTCIGRSAFPPAAHPIRIVWHDAIAAVAPNMELAAGLTFSGFTPSSYV